MGISWRHRIPAWGWLMWDSVFSLPFWLAAVLVFYSSRAGFDEPPQAAQEKKHRAAQGRRRFQSATKGARPRYLATKNQSFVKRRLRLASSSMAVGLDHIPESLFPLLASRLLLPLSILEIVAGVTVFVVGALLLSPILFKLNLRDEPH
jgi:hypothetical protein